MPVIYPSQSVTTTPNTNPGSPSPAPSPSPPPSSTQYFSGLTGAQQQTLAPWQQMWSGLSPAQQQALLSWGSNTPAQMEQMSMWGSGGNMPPVAPQSTTPEGNPIPGNARGGRPIVKKKQEELSPLAHALAIGLILHHTAKRLGGRT